MAAKKSEEMVVLRELVALHDMPYDPYARGGVARGFQTRQNRAWDAARRLVVESDGATVPQPAPDVQTALAKALDDLRAAVVADNWMGIPAALDAADAALLLAGRKP